MTDKKKENIAEYIIKMYRSEDLVRAFEFDLEKIGTHVINHLPISNMDKLSEVNFYEELIVKLKQQKLEKSGHLQELKELVGQLSKLSKSLLKEDKEYSSIFKQADPFIQENIKSSGGIISDEIQICLNGIYGFLLLKLNGKEVDDNAKEMLDKFGDLLSYLSNKYEIMTKSN